jgi:tetratricopeptide (TPR) repeat protein
MQMGLDKAGFAHDNPDLIGSAQVQLGLLRCDQAKYQEPEKLVRAGLATLEKTPRRADYICLVTARAALGNVLVESGAYVRGIALLEPIAARRPSGEEDQATLLDSLSTLAVAHHYAGHPDRAEALNRRALEFDRRNATHPRVALDLANIATTKVMQGQFAEAEALYREAAQIEEAWYGADHPDTVQLRSLIAMAVLKAGRLSEAEPLLRSVLAQQERTYDTKIHPNMGIHT